MRLILICTALLALAACQKPAQQAANQPSAAAEAGPHKRVDRSHKGEAIPNTKILNATGDQTSLDDLHDGRPMLLNLWASWCAPCVKELPTLNKMRDQRAGSIVVLPV